jgi:hypothetical protein
VLKDERTASARTESAKVQDERSLAGPPISSQSSPRADALLAIFGVSRNSRPHLVFPNFSVCVRRRSSMCRFTYAACAGPIRGNAVAATGADLPADSHRSTRGLFRSVVPRGSLERNPNAAVPETPTIRIRVPRDRCPRRPPRRGRRGRCPVRRSPVSSPEVVVPVTAAAPVGIVSPALVPEVARAPVMVIHGCRRRHRIGGARSQAESGNGEATRHQRSSAQAKPRTCVRCCFPCHIHAPPRTHTNGP